MANQKKASRKMFATTLSAAMVATAFVPTASLAAEKGFPDVPTDHKYYNVINDLATAGVITGYKDGEFKMGEHITRAEVSTMMAKILELDTDAPKTPFTDVKDDVWYTDAVNSLYEEGYVKGQDEDTFAPNQDMTRAEFAQLIVKAYGITAEEDVDLPFTDLKEGAWYESAIKTLYANDLISGQDATTFGPSDKIKRGDAAWLLANTNNKFGTDNPQPDENFTLSLMHTNDTHAHIDNVAKRVTAVKEVRAEKPDSLLIDAGDVFSGTLYFNEFKGQADMKFMNLMGYDVMTFGNHEFDLGSSEDGHKALADFVSAADFPFVSSNVDFSKDANMGELFNDTSATDPEDGEIYNSIVKEVDGEKVGIFGLTTEETADISSPKDVVFENYIEEAEEAVEELEAQGINKIIAVSHIGYDDNPAIDNDQLLAEVDGIDVIVGGHSHTELAEPVLVTEDDADKEPTVIVQAYQYGDFLGTLDVEFDENGVVVGQAGELIEIGEQEEDAEAAELLKTYSTQIDEIKNAESGGVAEVELSNPRISDDSESGVSVRNSETALGNLITDGMLAKAKNYNADTVIAIQNSGGIRTSIDQGPITLGEILTVLPFGNTLATMELTGAEIKQALEHSVSQAPGESGGFLQVSGMTFTYDSGADAGSRVQSVEVKQGEEYTALVDDETYVVATNAFTAKGGDGYDVFAKAYEEGRVTDLGLADWENLRDYVAELETVNPQIEERIVDVAGVVEE
jgi:5'-nucleotidase / UDP-sugar diphosphatase